MQMQAAGAKGWKDLSFVFSEKPRSSVDSDSALSPTDEGLTSRDVTGYGSRLDGTCSICSSSSLVLAPCGLQGCKNRPAPFPGHMSYKTINQALFVCHILAYLLLCCYLLGLLFCVLLVFVGVFSVFWLF